MPEVLTTLLMGVVAANRWVGPAPPVPAARAAEGRANRNQVSEAIPRASRRIPRIEVFGNEFPISVLAAMGFRGRGVAGARTHGRRLPICDVG